MTAVLRHRPYSLLVKTVIVADCYSCRETAQPASFMLHGSQNPLRLAVLHPGALLTASHSRCTVVRKPPLPFGGPFIGCWQG